MFNSYDPQCRSNIALRDTPKSSEFTPPSIPDRGDSARSKDSKTTIIFVVTGDAEMGAELCSLLRNNEYDVALFTNGAAVLERMESSQGCNLMDGSAPGFDGVGLIERLRDKSCDLPIIMLSGGATVSMAVRAMKAGATDFIEMPLSGEGLLASIERALHRRRLSPQKVAENRVEALTVRQHQILDLVVAGCPSKIIAADLGISQRTVENHRAAIMRKTGSKSIPALMHTAYSAGYRHRQGSRARRPEPSPDARQDRALASGLEEPHLA
jgi:two-component system, chemotaxis family, CheB/CheR fusion protein